MTTATKQTTTKSTATPAAKTTAKATETAAKTPFANEDAFKTAEEFTSAARDQFEAVMTTFTAGSKDFREQAEEMTGELRTRFEKTQERAAKVNADLVQASQTETAEAVQFANDLAQAKTFADALEVQRSYWTNLLETRMDRARALTETSIEVARENLEPVKSPFTAMFDTQAFAEMFRFPSKA